MQFVIFINFKVLTNYFLLNIAEHEHFSAYQYENPTSVGIFIFIAGEIPCLDELSMKTN